MALTIQQAAEVTGWSPRMLRYLERSGLVSPMRTPGGHRTYLPRHRLWQLAEYRVPTTRELEDQEVKRTAVYALA